MNLTQVVNFELGPGCNLGRVHTLCPNVARMRLAHPVTGLVPDELIIESAVSLYRDFGFRGLIGWIYYSEPLVYADRMWRLMVAIRQQAPDARFLLWTNGLLLPAVTDPDSLRAFTDFEAIVVTQYPAEEIGGEHVVKRIIDSAVWISERKREAGNPNCVSVVPSKLDGRRAGWREILYHRPCHRMFFEMDFDCWGDMHVCCYDWQNRAGLGNLQTTPLADLLSRWQEIRRGLAHVPHPDAVPRSCRTCGARYAGVQSAGVPQFVPPIAALAEVYLRNMGAIEPDA